MVGQPEIRRLGGEPPSPWEGEFGYCRLVTAGPFTFVSGTTSVTADGFVIGTTPYEQATETFRKLLAELDRVGLSAADVVQTRMYVTDISRADEVGRAHGEVFRVSPPVATMVEVTALIDPRLCVEIELTAYHL